MKKYSLSPERLNFLLDCFINKIVPVALANDFTLHELFSYCRLSSVSNYEVLRELWRTWFGSEYLKNAFRGRGGHLSKKYLQSIGIVK